MAESPATTIRIAFHADTAASGEQFAADVQRYAQQLAAHMHDVHIHSGAVTLPARPIHPFEDRPLAHRRTVRQRRAPDRSQEV